MQLLNRFLQYVRYPTTSDEHCADCPSTETQRVFAQALAQQMQEIGLRDVFLDAHGYLYGTLPATRPGPEPVIGLIAHMDTSPDAPGEGIQPRVVRYEGGDLLLNEAQHITLSPRDFPILARQRGKQLIVTDGTTLLGADDKAGIAEILQMAENLMQSGRAHGEVHICFTPDEEIGRGADLFDLARFSCDYAYTVDGGTLGELEYENFNAASAIVTVRGRSIHPGDAKGKMQNAIKLAMQFQAALPQAQCPEMTEGYEGFFHPTEISGTVERAQLHYIIRDHDREKFEEKKRLFRKLAQTLNETCGDGVFTAETKDSYYNMKEKILPHMEIIRRAEQAMRLAGMEPVTKPIRGGTDGARLSFLGLPCPNLCTGGENYHGRFEFIPLEDMQRCCQMLEELVCLPHEGG